MWHKSIDQHVELMILVKLNAPKTALITINDEQGLVIALHAKPHKGAANLELIQFLAEILNLPKTHIVLLRGDRSRYKKVKAPLNDRIRSLISDPFKFLKENLEGSRK